MKSDSHCIVEWTRGHVIKLGDYCDCEAKTILAIKVTDFWTILPVCGVLTVFANHFTPFTSLNTSE